MKNKSNICYQKSKVVKRKKREPIKEARRYVENAREILAERGKLDKEGVFYEDEKYVRAAGNYLWLGVLMALDGVFHVREDRRTRVNFEAYQAAVSKRDKKLLYWLNVGYEAIHLFMNYDGNPYKGLCDSGFEVANRIIDRCESMMPVA
jgi:hypothetical protein